MNVHRTLYKGVTEILEKMYFCPNNALKAQDNMTNAEGPKELFSKIIQLSLDGECLSHSNDIKICKRSLFKLFYLYFLDFSFFRLFLDFRVWRLFQVKYNKSNYC